MWVTLQREMTRCTACPRLVRHRERVARDKRRQYRHEEYWGRPVPAFGTPDARLLIVGLAPAAHGANRTGRMFTGDSSGRWLARALHRAGFANQSTSEHRGDGFVLHDALITASARCAPPDNKPSTEELARCRPFLVRELQHLQQLRAVIALGKVAFDAYLATRADMGRAASRPRPRFTHGAVYSLKPDGLTLIASYHPSQQNTQTGRLTEAMFDSIFSKARQILDGGRP